MAELTRRQLVRRIGILLAAAAVVAAVCSWAFRGRPAPAITSFDACARAGYVITDTNPPSCSDGHRSFVGPPTADAATPLPAGQSLPFELMVTGDSGGSYPEKQEVISAQDDWVRYWGQVHAAQPTTPPLLPVDFTANNVVALSSGRQQTNGYNLKVTGVTSSPTGSVVDYTLTVPTITCKVANTPSDRYFIAKTPRLMPPISFRLTTEYHRCP